MPGKVLIFPTRARAKRGDATTHQAEQHVIRKRLDEMGKDIKWLAGVLEVSPQTLYNTMNYRTELKQIHFSRLLKVLEISENYYYGVGKYAGQ
jgi:hypothetical protein